MHGPWRWLIPASQTSYPRWHCCQSNGSAPAPTRVLQHALSIGNADGPEPRNTHLRCGDTLRLSGLTKVMDQSALDGNERLDRVQRKDPSLSQTKLWSKTFVVPLRACLQSPNIGESADLATLGAALDRQLDLTRPWDIQGHVGQ